MFEPILSLLVAVNHVELEIALNVLIRSSERCFPKCHVLVSRCTKFLELFGVAGEHGVLVPFDDQRPALGRPQNMS